ncbi:MAG: hypothetical protein FD188_3147 [Ignavibacteria bacterium]|nr:MAG: hypothetical protein FD188_3147 [Ignavibacteria bacterium]
MADLIPVIFPKKIATTEINSPDFEAGFDEKNVVGGFPNNYFMCSICEGLPRHPVFLDKCGHLFCEMCMKQHFKINSKLNAPFLTIRAATCPTCKTEFTLGDVLVFDCFQTWAKAIYKTIQVSCPFDCEYKGNPFEVDHHQVFECPLRRIQCPNEGCGEIQPAYMMEADHFPQCPCLRIYCTACKLPVLASERITHDCKSRMNDAIQSTINFALYH